MPGSKKKSKSQSIEFITVSNGKISPLTSLFRQSKISEFFQQSAAANRPDLPSPLNVKDFVWTKRHNCLQKFVKGQILNVKISGEDVMYEVLRSDDLSRWLYKAKELAYFFASPNVVAVGTRVVAPCYSWNPFKEEILAGVVAEIPKIANRNRYLIFFDDEAVRYVAKTKIYVMCDQSEKVSPQASQKLRSFILKYLNNYPKSRKLKMQVGQKINVEKLSFGRDATVTEVDASIVQIEYELMNKREWIYRGSYRINSLSSNMDDEKRTPLTLTQPIFLSSCSDISIDDRPSKKSRRRKRGRPKSMPNEMINVWIKENNENFMLFPTVCKKLSADFSEENASPEEPKRKKISKPEDRRKTAKVRRKCLKNDQESADDSQDSVNECDSVSHRRKSVNKLQRSVNSPQKSVNNPQESANHVKKHSLKKRIHESLKSVNKVVDEKAESENSPGRMILRPKSPVAAGSLLTARSSMATRSPVAARSPVAPKSPVAAKSPMAARITAASRNLADDLSLVKSTVVSPRKSMAKSTGIKSFARPNYDKILRQIQSQLQEQMTLRNITHDKKTETNVSVKRQQKITIKEEENKNSMHLLVGKSLQEIVARSSVSINSDSDDEDENIDTKTFINKDNNLLDDVEAEEDDDEQSGVRRSSRAKRRSALFEIAAWSKETVENGEETEALDEEAIENERLAVVYGNRTVGRASNGTIVYHPIPKVNITFTPHICSPKCRRSCVNVGETTTMLKPIHCGWQRILLPIKDVSDIAKQISVQKKKEFKYLVHYIAPCGRTLRNLDEVYQFLLDAKYTALSIDDFSFNPKLSVTASFVPMNPVFTLEDYSNGTEQIPISCSNSIDTLRPPPLKYISKRKPVQGVIIKKDPRFLTGCDCKDRCQNDRKCNCHQFTEYNTYKYKRLKRMVPTGIYECNSKCKCNVQCGNRVVQYGIKIRLQLFRTDRTGWGVRCLDDVDEGAFICTYVGKICTEEFADQDGPINGDEYLADLDFIETAEQHKEGYEARPPEFDCDSDMKVYKKLKPKRLSKTRSARSSSSADNKSEVSTLASAEQKSLPNDVSKTRLLFNERQKYVIDAKYTGNIGRYFNHCCEPNMQIQNVFSEMNDIRFPHVAFFALRYIPAGQELTWDYGYNVGTVPDKILYCRCGYPKCRGRLL